MPESLGEMLAARRRRLGKSLAEAEAATRIRARRLEALEKEDWDALPDPGYVKGYIISYAQFLEMDPEPLLAAFRRQAALETAPAATDEPPPARRRVIAPRETVVASREHVHAIPWRAALGLAAAIAVISIAAWAIGRAVRGTEEQPPLPNVPESTATSSVEETLPGTTPTNTSPIPNSEPIPDETTEASPDAFTLTVTVDETAASWVRVTIDGLKAYEGTLAAGESKEWEVADTAVVRVGKVSAVTIRRNGDAVDVPIGSDGIGEVTLSAQQ
ncbi:MAG: DUF4115 domain-containing protein [Coriobacteriia bacterium]|nr:DUF4115 domain-containing protein [Coriobacteriia bacterium]